MAARKEKPKLTAAERHKRFVAMAREVQADESPEAFDKAFKRVTGPESLSMAVRREVPKRHSPRQASSSTSRKPRS